MNDKIQVLSEFHWQFSSRVGCPKRCPQYLLITHIVSQFGQKYNIVLDSCQMVTCKVAEAIIRGVKGKEAGTSEEAAYEREAFQENLRIQTQMAVLGMSALGI